MSQSPYTPKKLKVSKPKHIVRSDSASPYDASGRPRTDPQPKRPAKQVAG